MSMDLFMYKIQKLKIIEDIEKSFEDPEMQKKYKKWLKKRLKTESGKDRLSPNNFTIK